MHAILIRWHRWRVFRTALGSPERRRAVRAYLRWQRGRLPI